MNTAASLASPGTCAVLVGTGRHAPGSALPDLPSVDATLDALQRVLVEVCGLDPGQVRRVPGDAGPQDVVGAVEAAVAEATGTVLLYYVGHGLLGPRDELYLATHGSRSAESVAGAVPYRTLRDLLGEAAGGGVVVLDCCFSGRAAAPADGRPREPYASARPDGSLLLGSASHFALSFAPEDEPYTLFSGRLLRLLEEGDPAGPPWLTWDHLYAALDREFADGPVRPRRRSDGDLGRLAVARNRAYRPDAPPAATPPADVPCPYPGMEAFRVEDSGHFFGREELTGRLLDMVCAPGDRTRAVVLVGASGVGKSSLLRAGLLAALERRHETGRDDTPWPALLLPSPDERPLHALAELWGRATGRGTDDTLGELSAGRFPAPLPGRRPCRLLVVDQFEEVFTRCRDGGELARFLTLLTGDAPGRPRVVLGLRADHYGSALAHPALAHALEHAQLAVRPMNDDALHAAIEEPARAVGLTLEEGLADRLLHDLRQGHRSHREGQEHDAAGPGPGAALPFLAHALRETWLRRSGATLTLAGYQATGGIWHSVTTTTEALYQSLDGAGRQVLREMLLRLVQLTADGTEPVVRRRTGSDALLDGFTPSRQRTGTVVLNRLAEARLVTVDRAEVRISHEALLRAWPRLRRWIEEDRAELLRRQQLEEAADAWESAGRDPAYLYRGTRLAAVDSWAEARVRSLRALDREFLDASRTTARAERDREQRRTRRLKQALTGVAVALCLALLAGGVAFQQRLTAQEQRTQAAYRALMVEAENLLASRPHTAIRLRLAAYRLRPSAETRAAVFDTLARTPFMGSTTTPDFSSPGPNKILAPDGRVLVTHDGEHPGVTLWDVSTGTRQRRLEPILSDCSSEGKNIAFSQDSRIFAAVCGDGMLSLWEVRGGTRIRRTATVRTGLRGMPAGVAFSPDNSLLAVNTGEQLLLWDVRDPAGPERLSVTENESMTGAVAFSSDNRMLATASDSAETDEEQPTGGALWDITDPRRPQRLRSLGASTCQAFLPGGHSLVQCENGAIRILDFSRAERPVRRAQWHTGHRWGVSALAVSPDGTALATGSGDNTVMLWDVTDPDKPRKSMTLAQHEEAVQSLAFGDDGDTLTSMDERTVVRWKLTGSSGVPGRLATVRDPDRAIGTVEFSPQDETLVTVGVDGAVVLWDLSDPARPRKIATATGRTSTVTAVAISADGRTMAGIGSGELLLWDITDRSRPRRAATISLPASAKSLVFTSHGTKLAVGGGERSTIWAGVWDVGDPDRPEKVRSRPGGGGYVSGFSRDGRYVALAYVQERQTWSLDPTLQASLWDTTTPDEYVTLPAGSSISAFAPNGTTLATGDYDDATTVILWDIADPTAPRKIAEAVAEAGNDELTSWIRQLVFHPDGNLLAGISADRTVTLWNVGERTEPHTVTTLPGLVNDLAFSPGGRYLVTAEDHTTTVWDLSGLPAISADPVGTACEIAGGGLTREEWDEYVPGQPYEASCP
ncbi:AAA family ATPase [Streptomyces sp. NPDC051041]|uniref:caspase, EACC1-associated type n=1 Tax=Streptomyces sp. NPDC051041 TaxID=3365640 RepID=UPI0037AECBF7